MVPTVGVGVGVAGGVVGVGANVSLVTTSVGAVGLVPLEPPSQAVTKTPNRTKALIRVIPHATATAIPRAHRGFAIAKLGTRD
jgi:hypothetical protein